MDRDRQQDHVITSSPLVVGGGKFLLGSLLNYTAIATVYAGLRKVVSNQSLRDSFQSQLRSPLTLAVAIGVAVPDAVTAYLSTKRQNVRNRELDAEREAMAQVLKHEHISMQPKPVSLGGHVARLDEVALRQSGAAQQER